MKMVRLYTGEDGKSHFDDIEVRFEVPGTIQASKSQKVSSITFRRHDDDLFLDWHPAPVSQYHITLEGMVEITASDGTSRIFGPGDVMWANDLTGAGHMTRGVKGHPRVFVSIPVSQSC